MHYNRGRDFRPVPCEKTYGNTSWGDLLTSYNGTAFTYDSIGNPTKWRNASYIEWYGRQLSMFVPTTGTPTGYSYNADGIRTKKYHYDENVNLTGTTVYTLDGSTIVAENRLGTNIYYTYDDKGAIMGMYYGGQNYIFSKNLQGDVIGIYNENRQLVAKYSYNAYGEIMSITDASGNDVSSNSAHIANVNPFRYRGYYYDNETGFYYLQSRYYDPVVGRFLNADVYISTGQGIQGTNCFVYCMNDPINRIDSYGMWSIKEWFKEKAKEVVEEIVMPLIAYTEEALSDVEGTCSSGFNVCVSPSATIFNLQAAMSIDAKGDVEIQVSYDGGVSTGTPTISFTGFIGATNAPGISKLYGPYCQVGASAAFPIYGFPLAAGGDVIIIPDPECNDTYYGGCVNMGIGTAGAEVHVVCGETVGLKKTRFNVFRTAEKFCSIIQEW